MGTTNDEQLQVKLEVLNADNSVVNDGMILLAVEDFTDEITRQPIVFVIPTGPKSPTDYLANTPTSYALDLSMMNEMIMMSGVSPDNNPDPLQPNIGFLRAIVRTHWFGASPSLSDGLALAHGGIRLTVNEGAGQGNRAYQGLIVNFTSNRKGGQPRWEWKMTVQVINWTRDMAP